MHLVTATFVHNEVEPGWLVLKADIPIGKQYTLDLDRVVSMVMSNEALGRSMSVACVYVLAPGPPGFMPLRVFFPPAVPP